MNEKAIEFVMQFYSIDRETAIQLYADEIKSAESLLQAFTEE
jgi:hypothetical protein